MRNLTDYAVILNERDNVATAVVGMSSGGYALASPGGMRIVTVREEIKPGFKVAVSHIRPGEKVYKYGYAIGVAEVEIHPGECVHIHNMAGLHSSRSRRQR